jgi:hypothetical protein
MSIKPYTYTKCFSEVVSSNPLTWIPFWIVFVFETLTLPLYPLVYRMHKYEHSHFGDGREI